MKKLLIIDKQINWADIIELKLRDVYRTIIVAEARRAGGKFVFIKLHADETDEPLELDITEFDAVIMSYRTAIDEVPPSLDLVKHWVAAGYEKPMFLITSLIEDCRQKVADHQLVGDVEICGRNNRDIEIMVEKLKTPLS